MPSENIGQVLTNGLLMVANLFSVLKITKLSVPDLVQSNSSLSLDCEFSSTDDSLSLQWLFNKQIVYEWRPGAEPIVQGVLNGRLDDNYSISEDPSQRHADGRSLRIVSARPEMSGDYTCVVQSDATGAKDRQTKTLLVYSPEHEFALTVNYYGEVVEVNCLARGLYPQPSLILERNRETIPKQDLRVWRNDTLYDASAYGAINLQQLQDRDRVSCRLLLPQAGYTAMREKIINIDDLKHQLCNNEMKHSNSTAENKCMKSAGKTVKLHFGLSVFISVTFFMRSWK